MTAQRTSDIPEVKALLKARVESLVAVLLPDGHRAGGYWMARNPSRHDAHPGSFWVWLTGDRTGAYCDGATEQKGDVIGLIQLVHGYDFKQAMDWARYWLGISNAAPAEIAARAKAEGKPAIDPAIAAEEAAKKSRQAFASWLKCERDIEGTLADTYLLSRGIDLRALVQPPRALRFSAKQWHVESQQFWPCMIALMTGPDGKALAIHKTFLARDGSDKAAVDPARKIWPSFIGGAIRLAKGENKMTPEEASKHGLAEDLVLCEGVEDGLSLALAAPEKRVWAVGTLGNLREIKLPVCAHRVIVSKDNDWGKPQAAASLARGIEALAAQGRDILVGASPIGKDANDALRGRV